MQPDFHKDKALMYFLLVRDECTALGELREGNENDVNIHADRGALVDNIGDEVGKVESGTAESHIELHGNQGEENEEFVDMRRKFMENLQ